MKHLKLFNNESEYQSFTESADYVTPNVCAVKDGQGGVKKDFVFFNPEEEPELIIFFLDGKSYQFDEGMTWRDFINSDYNDGSFSTDSADGVRKGGAAICLNNVLVFVNDLIINNSNYSYYSSGGGMD